MEFELISSKPKESFSEEDFRVGEGFVSNFHQIPEVCFKVGDCCWICCLMDGDDIFERVTLVLPDFKRAEKKIRIKKIIVEEIN
jgi:hypothetical protein